MNIRNVGLILNRELKSYFSSFTVYIVIIMFLLMTGYFFYTLPYYIFTTLYNHTNKFLFHYLYSG